MTAYGRIPTYEEIISIQKKGAGGCRTAKRRAQKPRGGEDANGPGAPAPEPYGGDPAEEALTATPPEPDGGDINNDFSQTHIEINAPASAAPDPEPRGGDPAEEAPTATPPEPDGGDIIENRQNGASGEDINENQSEAGLPGRGLYHYKMWWYRENVDVMVNGDMVAGFPIFTDCDTLRVINEKYSYFIPVEKIDYIRTTDGLNFDALS